MEIPLESFAAHAVETNETPVAGADRDAVKLVVDAGRALHAYGTPAHRLEAVMERLSERLGMEGRFFCTPTSIFAAFGVPPAQETFLVRTSPSDHDLGKMAELDHVVNLVARGELDARLGRERVEAIVARTARFRGVLHPVGFAAVAAPGAFLLGGGRSEAAVAAGVALLVAALELLGTRSPAVARLFLPLSAFLASAAATAATTFVPELSVQVATIAAILPLLPGLTLTTAMTEVATGHLVSGTSRMAAGLVAFLLIGFGVALGGQLAALLPGVEVAAASPRSLDVMLAFSAVILSAVGLAVVLRARVEDVGAICVACLVAFFAARGGGALVGPELGAAMAAFALGAASNAYARFLDRPTAVPLVPGILLLVPGSIGFRSITSFLEDNVLVAVDTAFNVGLVGISLVAGLLLANLALPPRKEL